VFVASEVITHIARDVPCSRSCSLFTAFQRFDRLASLRPFVSSFISSRPNSHNLI